MRDVSNGLVYEEVCAMLKGALVVDLTVKSMALANVSLGDMRTYLA